MNDERSVDSFLLDIFDDPNDKMIVKLLILEDDDETILKKILGLNEGDRQ